MKSAIRNLALASASFLLPLAAQATTIQYTTYTSWKNAVTSPIELQFGAVSQSGSYSTASGKTLYPVSGPALPFVFTGPVLSGYQLTGGDYPNSTVALLGPTGGKGNITVTLPSGGENAIFIGLGSVGSSSFVAITFSDGETFDINTATNTSSLYGFSISHDISWLTLSNTSQVAVNDFFYGSSQLPQDTAQTPSAEVGTLLMIGGGLVALYGGRRKLFPPAASA